MFAEIFLRPSIITENYGDIFPLQIDRLKIVSNAILLYDGNVINIDFALKIILKAKKSRSV